MIILAILILLGTVFQGVAMFKTGGIYDFGIGYWGPLARDGAWHEALIGQLQKAISPQNPGFAGDILTNYHYYYDLLVAGISNVAGIAPQFLLYRFFPIIFSILLGIGTFILAQKMFKDKWVSYISVFFAFFGSSFGWMLSLIRQQEIGGESSFWANQPVSMNLNPPFAISLIILIFGIILLDNYLKKPKIVSGVIISILFGTLIGFKAYAGAIAIGALAILTIKKVFFDKSFSILPVFIASFAIFLLIYLSIGKGAAGLITFQPFWLVNTMIDAGDRVGIADLSAKRFAYLGGGKWFHFGGVVAISFVIFLIGNLGTRIVSLWGYRKKFLKSDLHLFILILALFSLIPTQLFVQKGNPWNIVQFFYYFMFFVGLYAANAVRKFPVFIIVVVLLITPISSFTTFRSWLYPNPPAYLPTGEYQALTFLSKQTNGTVLKHPFDKTLRDDFKDPYPLSVYADNAYVSAISNHPVYIEDVEQQLILNVDYQDRLKNADRFFVKKDLRWSESFLRDNKIRYVYLPKLYELPTAEQDYPMTTIFENEQAKVYKVNE